jgi:Mn-containing catalase
MSSFVLSHDAMHQNQWLAAIAELEPEGWDRTPLQMRANA